VKSPIGGIRRLHLCARSHSYHIRVRIQGLLSKTWLTIHPVKLVRHSLGAMTLYFPLRCVNREAGRKPAKCISLCLQKIRNVQIFSQSHSAMCGLFTRKRTGISLSREQLLTSIGDLGQRHNLKGLRLPGKYGTRLWIPLTITVVCTC